MASDRLHRFVLDGMAATAATCRRSRAFYYPYVEPTAGHGRGLLQRLSLAACIVVTDHYPAFFIPGLLMAAARVSAVRVEAVDSNGLIPLATHGRAFTSARSFRAFVQRELRPHLREFPDEHPLGACRDVRPRSTPGSCGDGRPPRGCSSGPRHSSNCQSTTPFLLLTRLAASGRLAAVSLRS